jgi:hypothetical protein
MSRTGTFFCIDSRLCIFYQKYKKNFKENVVFVRFTYSWCSWQIFRVSVIVGCRVLTVYRLPIIWLTDALWLFINNRPSGSICTDAAPLPNTHCIYFGNILVYKYFWNPRTRSSVLNPDLSLEFHFINLFDFISIFDSDFHLDCKSSAVIRQCERVPTCTTRPRLRPRLTI